MSINLKCDPDKAVELREAFSEVIIPGYHMNKTHWNTVFPEALKKDLVIEMIDDCYDLVSRMKSK